MLFKREEKSTEYYSSQQMPGSEIRKKLRKRAGNPRGRMDGRSVLIIVSPHARVNEESSGWNKRIRNILEPSCTAILPLWSWVSAQWIHFLLKAAALEGNGPEKRLEKISLGFYLFKNAFFFH